MAKLINILAASVGGGLVLGASIRLGEAIGSRAVRKSPERIPPTPSATSDPGKPGDLLLARLDTLAERLWRVEEVKAKPAPAEWQTVLTGIGARIDRQQAEMEAIRRQMLRATQGLESADDRGGTLRTEMRRQLSGELNQRVAAVEEKLHKSMEASHRETVEEMLTVLETRVGPRISRLENDVSGQAAAVTELKECSLQTERSIQRLLMALERVIVNRNDTAGTGGEQAGESPRIAFVNSSRPKEESASEIRRSALSR